MGAAATIRHDLTAAVGPSWLASVWSSGFRGRLNFLCAADVAAAGVTLVMSTHNLGQVKRLASRVLYLDGGRVAVDLPAPRFFTAELPADAAAFLRGERPWAG
jgi:ABC-type thiamine transport system ATPase subunit